MGSRDTYRKWKHTWKGDSYRIGIYTEMGHIRRGDIYGEGIQMAREYIR